MALYEVTLRQRFADQLCINVWNYFVVGGGFVTPSSLELLTLMGFIPSGDPLEFPADTVADAIWGLQDNDVTFLSAEARELYSVTDFYEAAYSPAIPAGRSTGTSEAPFIAYGFFTSRVRTDIRRGFKRFVGVDELLLDPLGVITDPGLALMDTLADAMSETLGGVTASYQPAVISRNKVVDVGTGAVTYELYATEAEQEEHVASPLAWAPYSTVRSQTSRQYNRGQ